MKMDCIYWLRRTLACIAVFSLTVATFGIVNVHDKDPKNVTLVFIHKDQGKAASLLLSAG